MFLGAIASCEPLRVPTIQVDGTTPNAARLFPSNIIPSS